MSDLSEASTQLLRLLLDPLAHRVGCSTDPANAPGGTDWIDLKHGAVAVTVEVRPDTGYGLYLHDGDGYGQRPDATYQLAEVAVLAARIQQAFA